MSDTVQSQQNLVRSDGTGRFIGVPVKANIHVRIFANRVNRSKRDRLHAVARAREFRRYVHRAAEEQSRQAARLDNVIGHIAVFCCSQFRTETTRDHADLDLVLRDVRRKDSRGLSLAEPQRRYSQQ